MLHFESENSIKIREADWQIREFDPLELRRRLIRCFEAVGRDESSYIADDLTLALEYSLIESARDREVFERSELELAMARLLEDTGYPDVAAVFQQDGGYQLEELKISSENIKELLLAHLACPPGGVQSIVDDVITSTRKLGMEAAPPQLLLELGRYYAVREQAYGMAEKDLEYLSLAGRVPVFGEAAQELINRRVLQIGGLSALLPSIRFKIDAVALAEYCQLVPVTTELEALPGFYGISDILAGELKRLLEQFPGRPPCVLHIAGLRQLVADYFGCQHAPENEALSRELAGALGSSMRRELFKCSFD